MEVALLPFVILMTLISHALSPKYRLSAVYLLVVLIMLIELFALLGDSVLLHKFYYTITIPYGDRLPLNDCRR